jgi:hypothetical protein
MSPMGKKEATNPFYVALLPVGVLFAVTACAYAAMAVRALDVRRGEPSRLMTFLAEYGLAMLVAELVVLGVLCLAAIGSDGYWERRFAARQAALMPRLPRPPVLGTGNEVGASRAAASAGIGSAGQSAGAEVEPRSERAS